MVMHGPFAVQSPANCGRHTKYSVNADLISRNSKSKNLLHAAHAVNLLVTFDIQARATRLSKAALLIRMHLR